MEPLENDKNPSGKLRVNTDPLIANRKKPFLLFPLSRYVDAWRLVAVKLEGIAQKILKDLRQLFGIAPDRRQPVVGDDGLVFLDGAQKIVHRIGEHGSHGRGLKRLASRADPGIGEQVLNQPLHASGAIDGIGDEFIRIGVQFPSITLGEELGVTAHHA